MSKIISENQLQLQENQISNFQETVNFYIKKTNLEVKDEVTHNQASKLKKEITSFINQSEKERRALLKPINDKIKEFNNKVKGTLEPLVLEKNNLTSKILNYKDELEKQRQAEILRVQQIKKDFLNPLTRIPNTVELCTESLGKTKDFYSTLEEKDQKNPEILEACNLLTSSLREKINFIKEEEIRKAEKERLEKIAKEQNAEALKQEQEKQRLEAEKRKQEADKQALAQAKIDLEIQKKKQQALKEQEALKNIAPKSNIRTYTKFEIVDPNLVPREYCEPSDKLINEAKKKGILEIPGIRFFEEKK